MNATENNPQDTQAAKMKLYALYLKDLQTVGTRQEHVRKYYLTLISAVFTVLSLGGNVLAFKTTPDLVWLVSIFGAALCLLWLLHMKSYSTLFAAKFNVLEEMEKELPGQPFTKENAEKKKPEINHRPMVKFDMAVAAVFFVLFWLLPFLPQA